jgi:hypothetical protein
VKGILFETNADDVENAHLRQPYIYYRIIFYCFYCLQEGRTALDLANENDETEVADILRSFATSTTSTLSSLSSQSCEKAQVEDL